METPKNTLQSPKGTRDLLFEKAELFAHLESVCAHIFRLYGYHQIRTPHFESVELFTRSIGEETDIVEKEMFVFQDRGDRQFALRPEGTAPVVRAYIEHSLHNLGDVTRLYYTGPMFRAERPQAGRFREFWQAGTECFGLKDPSADADTVVLLNHTLKKLLPSSSSFQIHLNTLGCSECRTKYKEKLLEFLEGKNASLCQDCQRRMHKNPLRVLDCKADADKLAGAPTPQDFLCPVCRDHFQSVRSYLDAAECPYVVAPRLVRGLDYYTGTVFEVTGGRSSAQNALAAGGRYDNLVSELGGPQTPAIGFAIGLDRIAEVVEGEPAAAKDGVPGTAALPGVSMVVMGPAAAKKAFLLLQKLREEGFQSSGLLPDKSMKAQMRHAGSSGAAWAVILGDRELEKNVALLKNLAKGSQEEVPLDGLVSALRKAAVEAKP